MTVQLKVNKKKDVIVVQVNDKSKGSNFFVQVMHPATKDKPMNDSGTWSIPRFLSKIYETIGQYCYLSKHGGQLKVVIWC